MNRLQTIATSSALTVAGVLAGYGLHALAQDDTAGEPLFYGGMVSASDGSPLEGAHAVTVRLFGQATGGTALCATPQLSADFAAGRFRVELPSGAGGCSEAVATNSAWTELTVDGDTLPRSRVGAVPFAVRAGSAGVAQSLVGEQALTLSALKTKVDGLATQPAPARGTLSYRVITTPSECVYDAGTNSTRCTCQPGEIASSGGAWSGPGNALTASRLDFRPEDNASLSDRVRVWSVTCVRADGSGTPCTYVQTTCIKASF